MSLKSYDLYGIKCESLELAKSLIEALLNMVMIAHEKWFSLWRLFSSLRRGPGAFHPCKNNYDDFEGEWTEESFSEFPFLFYVNETDRFRNFKIDTVGDNRIALLKHQTLKVILISLMLQRE